MIPSCVYRRNFEVKFPEISKIHNSSDQVFVRSNVLDSLKRFDFLHEIASLNPKEKEKI